MQHSSIITYTIPQIFEYLFCLCGDSISDKLELRHEEVKNMTGIKGMDYIYNAITNYFLNIAYKLVKCTGRLSYAITEWNHLIDANATHRTWMNFKDRFRRAYKEYKESSSLVAQQTPFQAV